MTKKKSTEVLADVGRTSTGLRDAIFDELDALRRGESNPTRANAVAKLSASIVETVRMEIDAQKFAQQLSRTPSTGPAESGIKTLALGT